MPTDAAPASGSDGPELVIESRGAVRLVILNRPATLNSFTATMHSAMARLWRQLEQDDGARAVVLTGAGSAFSAGGDLAHIEELQRDPVQRRVENDEARQIVGDMLRCRLPVIAAVNGPAVGLGCSVAVLADIVYLADSAYLADPHVAIGLTAGDGGAAVWPVLCGLLRAKEYLFTGDRITAAEAVRIGLATRQLPDDELLPAALAMAERLAALPAQALRSTKEAVNLHLQRAAAGVLEFALAAEYQSFDTPEHHAVVGRLRARATDRRTGSPSS